MTPAVNLVQTKSPHCHTSETATADLSTLD